MLDDGGIECGGRDRTGTNLGVGQTICGLGALRRDARAPGCAHFGKVRVVNDGMRGDRCNGLGRYLIQIFAKSGSSSFWPK